MQNHKKFVYKFDSSQKKKRKKISYIQHVLKRICETKWHQEIELKKFQECPICKSEAYHLGIVDKVIKVIEIIEE